MAHNQTWTKLISRRVQYNRLSRRHSSHERHFSASKEALRRVQAGQMWKENCGWPIQMLMSDLSHHRPR
jgi:hypothetical protein